jgi:hypothetical protein
MAVQAAGAGGTPGTRLVVSGTSFAPRGARGMSDLDYTEVVSELQEGGVPC